MARDKYKYMQAGDVLVDDSPTHRAAWENAGGTFLLHTSARESLRELAATFPSVKLPAD
jgi:hypothetical protein